MGEQRLEIDARIVAVTSKGHDIRRAEVRDHIKNSRLREMTEVVGGLHHTQLNSVPH